jgi:hypothetical protein
MLKRPDFPLGRVNGYALNYVAVIYVVVTSAVCNLLVSWSAWIVADSIGAVLPFTSYSCCRHGDYE